MTRFCLTRLAVFVLVCACAPRATGGITTGATATWTNGGGDNNWGTGENWSWTGDNGACMNVVPGSFTDATSPCYQPTVNIPDGSGTVNQNAELSWLIGDFSLGSGDVLNGFMSSAGNVTIAGSAVVNGGVSASSTIYPGELPGTLTNKGTINLLGGGVSGCIIVNSGTIKGYGSIFAPDNTGCGNTGTTVNATNTNTIEASGGNLQFDGTWNNAEGTIQIDAAATLQANGTITGGSLTNKGGAIVGGFLSLAGTVNASSMTLDCPAGAGACPEINVNGTVNHTGVLTVGVTAGLCEVIVNGGGVLNAGTTTLGVQNNVTGELLVNGNGTANISGVLTVGDSGDGDLLIDGSVVAGTINLGFEASGTGALYMGGSGSGNLKYSSLQAPARGVGSSSGVPGKIVIHQGATLTGTGVPLSSGPDDSIGTNVTLDGTWKVGNGLVVNAGTLSIGAGGALNVTCPECGPPGLGTGFGGGALQLVGTATVNASGSGATISTPGLNVNSPLAMLTVGGGAAANLGILLTNSAVTVSGNSSQITAQTTVYGSGSLTVENSAALNASYLVVNGAKAQLVASSSGTVTSNIVKVTAGSATIQPTATLNMTGSPGNLPLISIGDGTAAANLTIGGALNDATTINVFQNGTLQIANGASVTLPGLNPRVSLAGGTVDVTQGQLIIGNAVSAGQDWVTVGLLGTLSGGKICPEPSSSDPNPGCTPNTLFGGPGHVKDNVSNRGGTVSISDPTTLDLSGSYTQTSGTLDLEIDGTQAGQYDQLVAGGSIQITGGTIEFDFGNGFAPAAGNAFNLLSGAGGMTVSGTSFTTTGLANGFSYTTNATADQFDLTAQNAGVATTIPTPPPISSGARQLSSAAAGVAALAPGSLASVYAASGTTLSTGQPTASGLPWQTSLNGTSVAIVDATGASTPAPLLYVSASQVNFLIPDSVALGPATVTVTSGTQTVATGQITVTPLAPALFTLNTSNLAAAYAECISSGGTQTVEDPFQVVNGAIQAQPLNLNACAETILQLYATGLDIATAADVQATIGNATATVQSAGPGGMWPGLDQVDVVIPLSPAGAGSVPVTITAGGLSSNTVNVTIQ
jgi:uncharacterized protein (TIGR03437 family)